MCGYNWGSWRLNWQKREHWVFFCTLSIHIQSTILNITLRNKAKFKSIHFRVAWNFLKKPFIFPGFIWILQNHVYCCFTMYWIFVEKKVQTLWLWKLFSFFYLCVANCFLAFLLCLLISLSCLILSDSPFKEVSRNSLLHLTLRPATSLRSNHTCKVGANGRVQLLQNTSKVLIQTKQCFLKW